MQRNCYDKARWYGTLGESIDQYALRTSSIFTRLLGESQCTVPANKFPDIFAWERLKFAVFRNRLLPSIRIEQIREDPAHSFASASDRARKHASNNLHDVNVTNLSSIASTPSPSLKTQLETRLDDVQATIASLVEAPTSPKHHKRGHFKTERRAAQGRQDSSVPRRDRSSSKATSTRVTRPNTYNYEHCMRPTTHKTEDCLFVKLAAKLGTDP